ncbi:MAG: RecX family transcriptional regulator [Firmicutes bacterium]|nr:RecX family transcriptional regulator [Bacillota bacterium]
MKKFKEYGYINDKAIAEAIISSQSKRLGRRRIEQKLIQKGIDKELVKELFENFNEENENAELDAATNLAKKWLENQERRAVGVDLQATRNRLYAHLAGKGFSISIISQAWDKTKTNP